MMDVNRRRKFASLDSGRSIFAQKPSKVDRIEIRRWDQERSQLDYSGIAPVSGPNHTPMRGSRRVGSTERTNTPPSSDTGS